MGDEDPIRDFFKQYYKSTVLTLIQLAKRFVPADIAENIVQDVFLGILENTATFNKYSNRLYLFTTVRNECINCLRRKKIEEKYISHLEKENQQINHDERDLDEEEQINKIYSQIEQLPNKCRKIFKLAYVENKKSAEIAETLNLSVRTVEHQLYLSLKSIRAKLLQEKEK